MGDSFFTNFTSHDIVIFHEDGTKTTIPKSGKVMTIASNSSPEKITSTNGVPIFSVPKKDRIEGVTWEDIKAGSHIIVSTMAAEFLAELDGTTFPIAVYAPSTLREHQVRDEKGAMIGIRALQLHYSISMI